MTKKTKRIGFFSLAALFHIIYGIIWEEIRIISFSMAILVLIMIIIDFIIYSQRFEAALCNFKRRGGNE